MNHEIYKQWLQLAVENELTKAEQNEFDKHLLECPECRVELEELKSLKSLLLKHLPVETDDQMLLEARQMLRNTLRKERNRQNFGSRLKGFFGIFASVKLQIAFGGIVVLAAGIFIGYIFFNKPAGIVNSSSSAGQQLFQNVSDNFSFAQNDVRITNVRFIDQNAKDGEIEFIFDAVKPVRIKGNINDERIKNILTYSMLNVENPGVRLNSINAISSENKSQVDTKVKSALISVAKFDDNPGVRRQAIKLLSTFNDNEDVKNTLLYVLMNDKISGNRIEAINSLIQAQKQGTRFSQDELSVFKEKMKADDNNYIRFQAKAVLMKNDPNLRETEIK